MSKAGLTLCAAIMAGIFLFTGVKVSADIYRYQDEKGVWHFTNIKKHGGYRLFIRTKNKSPSQYIKEYQGMITEAARRYGVDPSLIKAVIKAESGFDHQAVSHKGAQGLMQLMPETADDMRVHDPFDPEENILGGTRYLSLLLKKFNNDKRLAVAAYNAGPDRVDQYKGIPPFSETKAFVSRVMDYYRVYASSRK
jgi:soluble lytic murein transglycosylase